MVVDISDLIKYAFISIGVLLLLFVFISLSKPRIKEKKWFVGIIVLSIGWIVVIYWFPPMKVYETMRDTGLNSAQSDEIKIKDDLMLAEFNKVSGEISENSKDNKQWFYYKLILVGALIGAIVAQVLKSGGDNVEFMDIIGRKFFTITVGLAFALCVIIDIQVKQNLLVTDQLGSWIAYHFEPFMMKRDTLNGQRSDKAYQLNGWENYLRAERYPPPIVIDKVKLKKILDSVNTYFDDTKITDISATDFNLPIKIEENNYSDRHIKKTIKKYSTKPLSYKQLNLIASGIRNKYNLSNSTHTDLFYSIFHFPAFHILTWLLYAFYIISFYHFICTNIIKISLRNPRSELSEQIKRKYRGSLDFIFWTVNLMILIFAILSRAQSGIFEMRYSLFSNQLYTTPILSGLYNLLLAFLFIVLPNSLFYIISIRNKYLKIRNDIAE